MTEPEGNEDFLETPGSAAEDAATAAPQAPADEAGAAPEEELLDPLTEMEKLVTERTEDLQRLQAEYANYKKRVDRDRSLARQSGIDMVMRELMPVFDSIVEARKHDELTGGFKLTADELTRVLARFGFESFGEVGDNFDPRLHEALMQVPSPQAAEMSIHEVMQVGYRIGDQVLRPARVVVAVPATEPVDDEAAE